MKTLEIIDDSLNKLTEIEKEYHGKSLEYPEYENYNQLLSSIYQLNIIKTFLSNDCTWDEAVNNTEGIEVSVDIEGIQVAGREGKSIKTFYRYTIEE